MGEDRTVCVGLDMHKARIAVAVAEPGRSGEVRFHGEIANQPETVRRLIERLADKPLRSTIDQQAVHPMTMPEASYAKVMRPGEGRYA